MELKTKCDVYKNSKTKVYSDGSTNTIACRSAIFKDSFDVDLERLADIDENHRIAMEHSQNIIDFLHAHDILYDSYHERKKALERAERTNKKYEYRTVSSDDVRGDSLKRAKDSIFDYVLNNRFEYFFTGTINPEFCDSKSPREVLKPVQDWLKNMRKRYGLSYLLIAERHKNGGIHFHGVFYSEKPLKMQDSGTKLYKGYSKPVSDEKAEELGLYGGRTVYNLKTWSFGFSTAIKLTGDIMTTAFYITKYITKDCKKIFGKFFWHSRDLKKPQILIQDVDFDSIECIESNGFKYQFKRGDANEEKGTDTDM